MDKSWPSFFCFVVLVQMHHFSVSVDGQAVKLKPISNLFTHMSMVVAEHHKENCTLLHPNFLILAGAVPRILRLKCPRYLICPFPEMRKPFYFFSELFHQKGVHQKPRSFRKMQHRHSGTAYGITKAIFTHT